MRPIEEIERCIEKSKSEMLIVRNAQQVLDGEWEVLRGKHVELLKELAQAKKEATDAK